MNQTLSISHSAFKSINNRLDRLEAMLQQLLVRFQIEAEPTYGTDEWWKWSDNQAKDDIKAGRTITIHNHKELDEFFKNL